jgi:exopolysaccharide production protein ExoQ
LGAAGLLAIRSPSQAIRAAINSWPVLVLPILAVASVAWSNYPDVTLRASVQLVLTILAAILMVSRFNARQFLVALFLSSCVTCLACLAFPSYAEATDGIAFVGIMGSKNQLAFLAGTLILTALAIVIDRKHLKIIRLAAIGGIVLGLGLVVVAKSAGGLLDAIAGCVIFVSAVLTIRLRRSSRAFLMAAAIILATPAVIMAPTIQNYVNDFIVDVLHKDTTLTGRTYLWDRAASISAERPLLGVGYNAFWVQGESDAEGLWAYGGITARTGFNFHNQYIDIVVMLGWLGLIAFVFAVIYTSLGVGIESLIAPSVAGCCLLANVVVCVIRSFTESGLISEFNFFFVIFFAAGLYGWKGLRSAAPSPGEATAPPVARPRGGVDRPRQYRPTRSLRRAPPART